MDHNTIGSPRLEDWPESGPNGAITVGSTLLDSAARGAATDAPAVRELKGCSSNTTLHNSASNPSFTSSYSPKTAVFELLRKGIDTLHFSCSLEYDFLEAAAAQVVPLLGTGQQSFDGFPPFVVSRVGGFQHTYKVRFADGLEILLPGPNQFHHAVKIVVGAKACLLFEADLYVAVVDRLSEFLLVPAAHIEECMKVSRADVYCDILIPESEFQRFCKVVGNEEQQLVTRARKITPYREDGRYTGVVVGSNELMLRVYDKKAQAVKDKDWDLWSDVYGRELPEGFIPARFEYQLRGQSFRSLALPDMPALVTWADFQRALPAIVEYLTHDWFRLAGKPRGKDKKRFAVPLWSKIASAFTSGAWSRLSERIKRRLRRHAAADIDQLYNQVLGCLATVSAALARQCERTHPLSWQTVCNELQRRFGLNNLKWELSTKDRFDAFGYGGKWRSVPVRSECTAIAGY